MDKITKRNEDPDTFYCLAFSALGVLMLLLCTALPLLFMSKAQLRNFPSYLMGQAASTISPAGPHATQYYVWRYGNPNHGTRLRNYDFLLLRNNMPARWSEPLYDRDPIGYFEIPFFVGLGFLLVLVFAGKHLDAAANTDVQVVRGRLLVSRKDARKRIATLQEPLGLAFIARNKRTITEKLMGREGYALRLLKKHEAQGIFLSGAPGSGKTQTLFQLLDQVYDRNQVDYTSQFTADSKEVTK